MGIRTSEQLTPGQTYSRGQLRELFSIADKTLDTGIFQPAGHDSVWLFVTEDKASHQTQYVDRLLGDDLHFEGQTKGRTDRLVAEHRERRLELLLFHRVTKKDRADFSFTYKGPFEFVDSQPGPPTKFHLRRVGAPATSAVKLRTAALPSDIRENVRRFARDAADSGERALSLVRQTSYWVFDEDDGEFGPSKFVAYERMTFPRYAAAVAGRTSGAQFDGQVARNAIEGALGAFGADARLAALLARQLRDAMGKEALAGVDQRKWEFASIPATRGHWTLVCNPQKFRGKEAADALEEIAWTVDRGDFKVGDRIALWQSKGRGDDRGIVALGEVAREALEEPCPEAESRYWVIPYDDVQRRIRFAVWRGLALPLWESPAAEWLGNLAAARARGGTVFALQPAEWHSIVAATAAEHRTETPAAAARASARQGYGLTAEERTVVELHAQRMTEEHFIELGFEVADVSRTESFDLKCTNGADELRIEVKGTTGAGEIVILTSNEVAHAREHGPRMVLAIVSNIELERGTGNPTAAGGTLRIIRPWSIDDGILEARQYGYRPGPKNS